MAKRVRVKITPELVGLFRAAMPAWEAQWREIITSKKVMTDEESRAAHEAVCAFDQAAGVLLGSIHPCRRELVAPALCVMLCSLW
jgi:hypothetical protein